MNTVCYILNYIVRKSVLRGRGCDYKKDADVFLFKSNNQHDLRSMWCSERPRCVIVLRDGNVCLLQKIKQYICWIKTLKRVGKATDYTIFRVPGSVCDVL